MLHNDFNALPVRLRDKILIELNGCWLWLGNLSKAGYGRSFATGIKTRFAHLIVYQILGNHIPEELEADHLCRVRHCVNPMHLEFVPHKINILRGESPSAKCAKKTHCIHGHPFDEENTYRGPNGERRTCKICRRETDKRRPRLKSSIC
jgi:HNH endonuclease